MKKQINSVNNFSVKGIITITILSAMLSTFGATANNKPTVAVNAAKVEVASKNVVENRMNSNTETTYEAVEAEQYNAEKFVEAEMALEIECWSRGIPETNQEAGESEPALPIGAAKDNNEYNAKKFVEAEMSLEIESWKNNSGF